MVVGSVHEPAFLDAGWTPGTGARPGAIVQVADLREAFEPDPDARLTSTADEAWLRLYPRAEDPEVARAVLEGPRTVGFVSIGDPTVAIGRVVVTGEWAGVAAVEVVPERRREGLARRIVDTALAWATERGADKAYLQTMRDNTAALALYEPYGFVDHHEYRYLRAGHDLVSRHDRATYSAMSTITDEHDLGLAHDLPTLLNRRRALGLLSGVGLSAALAACGLLDRASDDPIGDAPPSGGIPPPDQTGSRPATRVGEGDVPAETGGPFPADGTNGRNVLVQSGIVRSDITGSFGGPKGVATGVPTTWPSRCSTTTTARRSR